jgi:hypothetical protein
MGLAKIKQLGMGVVFDEHAEGTKTTALLSLSHRFLDDFSLGVTGKWRGGFNFDCGGMMKLKGERVSIGLAARNLRNDPDTGKYLEGGVATFVVPERLVLFCDVIHEDGPWRYETGGGCGISGRLEHGFLVTVAYFMDGTGDSIVRASLGWFGSHRLLEGEYAAAADGWDALSIRLSGTKR